MRYAIDKGGQLVAAFARSRAQVGRDAGDLVGMAMRVTTETAEGITVEVELSGKVYGPEDYDHAAWTLSGEPDTAIVVDRPATPELTCATPVNRIPQVINARAGYVTTDELPCARYLVRPMNEYVDMP